MYEEDQLAWRATDVLQATVSRKELEAEQPAGWVVDTTGETPVVRFLRQGTDAVEASRDVVFKPNERGEVVVPNDRRLTAGQLAKFWAVRTAERALRSGEHPWCGGTFNYVVLSDPDGSGLLVYFLRAKPADNLIPVGGHYRITVSEDGKTAEQVDQLFASCLTMDKKSAPAGGETVGISMSHVVSSTPLETHVFLSLQERLPFYVITPDSAIWHVEAGRLERANPEAKDTPAPGPTT